MDGADKRRAAPAIHAARLAAPGPYAAVSFRPAHRHARIRIARYLPTPFLPAGSPSSHRPGDPSATRDPAVKILIRFSHARRRLPLTTYALAGDYLVLCRNPLKDLNRWVLESGKKHKGRSPFRPTTWRSAHAQNPSPRLASRAHGFRDRPIACNARPAGPGSGENGAKVIVCLLDREPVLTTMTACDRYEMRWEDLPHQQNPMPKDRAK